MKIKLSIAAMLAMLIMSTTVPAALAGEFNDVSESHTNYTAIMDLQARGIINGYPDGTFKPDQQVNRVEALKIILLGADVDMTQTNGVAEFTDTDTEAWYAQYINKAVSLGIVQGYPDGSFKPEQTINLVEALKIVQLANSIDLAEISLSGNPYADAAVDEWYAPYVQYAKEKNLIDADAENKIYPSQGMTRGKLAELIYRLLYIEDNGLDSYTKEVVVPEEEEPAGFVWNVNITDMKFKPADMTVGVGSTVKWTNNDDVGHTVTSDGSAFDSGTMEAGDTFEHTFTTTGTFDYHCELHPTMTGTITVKPANEVPTI